MATLNLAVEGLTCRQCAMRAQVALRRVAGVSKARVNTMEKLAMIEYDEEQVSPRVLLAAVRDEGFKPGAVKLRMAVKGLRCASCVSQVETALTKTPGVLSASLNVATTEVDIEYEPTRTSIEDLNRAVANSGYELVPAVAASEESVDKHADEQAQEYRGLMRKFWFAALISIPVMFFSYPDFIPGLREWMPMGSDNRRIVWGLLGLATLPVLAWSGSQFYSGMWSALKHRTANMHTLIASGITAAFVYSAVSRAVPAVVSNAGTG